MKEFIYFIKKQRMIFVLLFIILFIIYFYYFNNIISIDTEIYINNSHEMLKSWIGINRFSLVFLKNIMNMPFNIMVTRILTFILFYVSILNYTYLFTKWANKKDKILVFLISITLGSSAIFAEQFGFSLQSLEISIGLLLFAINFMLLDNYFEKNQKINLILSIIITIFCFGLYQTFVILYIGIALFYILTHENNKIKELFAIFLFSFIFYYLIGYIVKNYIYIIDSSYLSRNFKWKDYGILKCILRIGYFGVTTLFGLTFFHSVSYFIFVMIGFIILIKRKKIKSLLLYLILAITPFSLIILTASNTAYRAQFSYIFILVFMFLYLIKITNYKKIIYILLIVTIIKQVIITPILLCNDYQRFEKDLNLAHYIGEVIQDENKCVIFVGKYDNSIKIKGETLGNSFASWDHETALGVNVRMNGFLQTQNINYRMPTIEEYEMAKQVVLKEQNKIITYYENYIIINLDNIR